MNYTIIDTLSLSLPIEDFRKFYHSDLVRLYAASQCDFQPHLLDRQGYFNRENPVDLTNGDFIDWRSAADVLPSDFWQNFIVTYLESLTGLTWDIDRVRIGSGRNGFQNSASFVGGFIAWGGNNVVFQKDGEARKVPERVQIYFDAVGCQYLTENDAFKTIHSVISLSDDPRITRCDPALDCLDGQITIQSSIDAYHAGMFNGNGRPPKAKYVQTLGENDDGETLYIGSRQSGKMARIYEKGKQLGDPNSTWVRVEIEYLRKDRHIDLDVLIDPDRAFSESYKFCFDLLNQISETDIPLHEGKLVQIVKLKEKISLDHLIKHGQRAYGKLINYLALNLSPSPSMPINEQIVAMLRVEGLPSRLLTV